MDSYSTLESEISQESNLKECNDDINTYNLRNDDVNKIKKELENSVTIRDNKSIHTKKTYFYYNDAVIFAKSTLENPSSSIEELKSAYNKLIASKNNLVKLSPNINKEKQDEIKNLEKAIEECKLTKKGAEVYSRKCTIYF
ncbi:MAG: hypothetical protein E7D92_01970 [Anaerococcus sp.]|uniref:hypothetical protein n=1 Tax=Anaerococcus sp. TaxID=1872515 RepID=UPI002905270A|nr:hypothetical protein [Anaerococcus sp.]MDU2353361.1 hypothetical protein [Anaerococcus sp.]